jgi:hypothetical protein
MSNRNRKVTASASAPDSKQNRHGRSGRIDMGYLRYETLKAEINEKALTSSEYQLACRRAAQRAGV